MKHLTDIYCQLNGSIRNGEQLFKATVVIYQKNVFINEGDVLQKFILILLWLIVGMMRKISTNMTFVSFQC